MLLFFMLTSALRAAGDARTPLRLGVTMTILNVVLNLILIRGLGPIPALGTMGSALGTVIASSTVSAFALYPAVQGPPRHQAVAAHGLAARLDDHPSRCSDSACRPACRASR